MNTRVPRSELDNRMKRFRVKMDTIDPDWEIVTIFSKVNLYFFTGTIQDGMLLIPRDKEACLWVKRSYERAMDESLFPQIRSMRSYRDAAQSIPSIPDTVYIETEQVPLALFSRLRKHFPFKYVRAVDKQILQIRSVKSPYELGLMERSGEIHRIVLEELVPNALIEGISEAEFTNELYRLMMEEGHHGIVRFGMFESEIMLGLIGFGESSIYPTYLDSPGGNAGLSPAVPLLGSRDRKLQDGDLVFVDIGCGFHGYHTDKTMTYFFGRGLTEEVTGIHRKCVEIQDTVASLLEPGAIPSQIYESVIAELEPSFLENFMGYGNRKVQFIGHGIGLEIAEHPVIAKGFDNPLEEGMVIALEPKNGIKGVGMVGTENTFVVTSDGGRSITGNHPGLMQVG